MQQLLKKHFGYENFRPLQEEIINHVVSGGDSFVLMPTGGGKSLCYQLPALKLPGVTLVVSPLIALMKDQVDALKANGIAADLINSSLSLAKIKEIQRKTLQGENKIIYVAPERLTNEYFQGFLKNLNLSLISIDEAHCISEWGHDFRPDYRNLKNLRSTFSQVPVIALTATATNKVQQDILSQLSLEEKAQIFISSFNRKNLEFIVTNKKNALEKLVKILRENQGQSVIVYCFSRKETQELAENLNLNGFKALPYHAGLSNEERKKNQELFIKDEVEIMTATIAFGMGIDKPDIRLVVHYTFPKSLEGYYQEIGRAGRDGLPSKCVLFYSYGDRIKHDFFIKQIEDLSLRESSNNKIKQVADYCQSLECRRRYLLSYFGEEFEEENCQACDICLGSEEVFDGTEITKKIISAIVRTESRFGVNYIVDVLRGSRQSRVLSNNHNELSVFGIGRDFSGAELRHIIRTLIAEGILKKGDSQYPILKVTPKGARFVRSDQVIQLRRFIGQDQIGGRKKGQELEYDQDLFEKLRKLRKEIALEQNVAPFVIFSDVSLQEMAFYLPRDREQFSRIQGVGEQKLENFSASFLEVISKYCQAHNLTSIEVPKKKALKKSTGPKIKKSFYQKTKQGLMRRLTIREIAKGQERTEDTIINHIGKMIQAGEKVDIDYLRPSENVFQEIKGAFEACGNVGLRPVYDYLEERYSYVDIKLVALFL